MSDIVKELRDHIGEPVTGWVCEMAADEITRLRAALDEIAELRAALKIHANTNATWLETYALLQKENERLRAELAAAPRRITRAAFGLD
jgi:hypothetical protein